MTDIAAELGVSESRVSQMRAEALRIMRDGLKHVAQSDAEPLQAAESGRAAANKAAYCRALGMRSTLSERLAMSNVRGEVIVGAPLVQIA